MSTTVYNTVKLSACTELATTKIIIKTFLRCFMCNLSLLKAMLPHAEILIIIVMKHEVRRQPPED
jgi:hypothetical protein